jgi:anti-sigma regulatory factor (Ser/Thr protein kinase)
MPERSSFPGRPHLGAPIVSRPSSDHGVAFDRVAGERIPLPRAGQHLAMGRTATSNRELLLALEPRPESARLARRALSTHGLHEDVEHTVTLLATEVVANAVRHANLRPDQRIVFFARMSSDFARVEVADQGQGFEPESVRSEGFGLRLLSKLSSRWGVDCTDRGCKVWFEVDRRSNRFARTG